MIARDKDGAISITSTHADYDVYADDWRYIGKVMSGRGVRDEIPTLNPSDTSPENAARNTQYKKRAWFRRIAGRTVNRMVGLVFAKWPTLRVPPELDYITSNVDGAGASVYQQSQAALKSAVAKGRAGLLVEYPTVHGETTRDDMEKRKYYATIQRFEPDQILNWSLMRLGANMALDRVVLRDNIETAEGPITVIRELRMDWRGGETPVYVSREWRSDAEAGWYIASETVPLDGFGETWDEIPFAFIGSETNQPRIDEPPMLDICEGNVCHYRLHADYMDSVHHVGQPQGYVDTGVEPSEIKGVIEALKEAGWYYGSRMFAVLPKGGRLGFASVPPNTMAKEAMDATKDDLIGMGAFYITPGSAIKTATQAAGEQEEQHSVLSLAASNVAEAYSKALVWMARFMRVEIEGKHEDANGKIVDDTPLYDLRRDFVPASADPQLIQALWTLVMQGGMPISDFWQKLRKAEIIDPEKDDEEIKDEIAAWRGAGMDADLSEALAALDEDAEEGDVAAAERNHPELNETAGA